MLAESVDEEQIIARVAALDIGKAELVCCVRVPGAGGAKRRLQEVSTHSTMTRSLGDLANRLVDLGVERVVMEATSDYWKPVFYLLEAHGLQPWLVNARDVRHLPGRPKTDVLDAVWLCKVAERQMLRASFVPPRPIRQLRDLTRYRIDLVGARTAEKNRVEKLLEDACIKLSVVASDIFGVSGRQMMAALIAGERDPKVLAEMARTRMRAKIPQLVEAFTGQFDDHHAFLAHMICDHIDTISRMVAELNTRIDSEIKPYRSELELLDSLPGVDTRTAEVIIAEIGTDMSRFPTADHLASWAGMSPGNDQSAGKRRSGRTTKGDRWLRQTLTQAAWAASHTKGTYLSAQYHRLAARRGKKRAIVALGHTLLTIVYYLLERQTTYVELGADFLDRLDPDRLARQLVKRLEKLGHKVTLEPRQDAA